MSEENPQAPPVAALPETSLIPAGPPPMAPMVLDPTQLKEAIWTSLTNKTPEERELWFKALGTSDLDNVKVLNQPFPTRHILIHEASKTDPESGEVYPFPRIVLIGPDGTTVAFGSTILLRWISRLCVRYGNPPWNPPVRLVVYQVNTGAGRRTFNLRVEDAPPLDTPPHKKESKRGN